MRKSKVPFERDKAEAAGEVDFFSCYVMGELWRYGVVTAAQMKILGAETDPDAHGLCDGVSNIIYILEGRVRHPVVIHELCHAHMYQSQTQSAKLSADQVEEIMCDIFAYNWSRILLLSRTIVHNLSCYGQYLKGEKKQPWESCLPDMINEELPNNLVELVATYATGGEQNPLLKCAIGKKKRRRRS
jgi:hypothetical protein